MPGPGTPGRAGPSPTTGAVLTTGLTAGQMSISTATVATMDRRDTADALAGASTVPFWLDTPARPVARPPLAGPTRCDLAVVGGGYTGLWTALRAKERDPDRDVVLVEADRVGGAASGRNGGFCDASLTHGPANGRTRFPDEYDQLHRLGLQNLDEIEATVARYGIDCDFRRSGGLTVATETYQVAGLRSGAGIDGAEFLDAAAVRREMDSPTYRAGLWDRDGVAVVDPARLAWGLADAAERAGVRIAEHTTALRLAREPAGLLVHTPAGPLRAGQVALATNAYTPLLRRLRPFIVPVYDHVLVTEPLDADQLDRIGWAHRQGVSDSGNRFHYYRLTADHRILWGGYDAIYHFGRRVRPRHEHSPATVGTAGGQLPHHVPAAARPALHPFLGRRDRHLHPVLRVLRHRAGGRVGYAPGYTGLGVGATGSART